MQISTKLTVAAALAVALVTGTQAVLRIQRLAEVLESDVRRDHATLGRALAEAVAALIEHAGPEEALLTIEEADQRRSGVTIRWDTRGHDREASQTIEPRDGHRVLVTRVPVVGEVGRTGVVELVESLAPQQRYVRDSAVRAIAFSLLTILACAALLHLAGWLVLGRPLSPILEKLRRIGEGDLGDPLALRRADELGVIAREVDRMCADLAELRERAAQDEAARVAALDHLRHADRLATVGKLAAGIAHELGTPLNVVGARAKMIQRGESEGDEIVDDARVIAEQTDRMAVIIRGLLDFARRSSTERAPTDVRGLVASALDMLGPLAARVGVSLRLGDSKHVEPRPASARDAPSEDSEPVEADVDAGRVQQVVINLVMNGIQAQPDGGEVIVTVRAAGDAVQIVADDRGPGIPEDVRPHVFEPFFTTKPVGVGSGLGLSVVYGIVEEHGGHVHVDAAPGGGARFVVTLPKRP